MACGNISNEWQEKSVVESTESVHLLSELSVNCSQAGNQEVVPLKKVLKKDLGAIDSTSIEESEVTLHPAAAAYIVYSGEPRTSPQPVSVTNLGAIPRTPRAASSSSRGLSSQSEAVSESALPANLQSDQLPARPQFEAEQRCGLLCRSGPIPVDNQSRIITVCNSCYRRVQTFSRTLRITDIRDRCTACNRETRVAVSHILPQ